MISITTAAAAANPPIVDGESVRCRLGLDGVSLSAAAVASGPWGTSAEVDTGAVIGLSVVLVANVPIATAESHRTIHRV